MSHKDPEARRAYQHAYYLANREHRLNDRSRREMRQAWKAANKSRTAETNRLWREANYDRDSETHRLWYIANREHVTARTTNRRARRYGATGTLTGEDIRSLLDSQGWCCAYCGSDVTQVYHVDHMLSMSRGGSNTMENLAIACPTCNLRKGTKTVEEWLG